MVRDALSRFGSVDTDSIVIYPAKGFYRQRKADVQAWTGYARVNGIQVDLGSWDNVTTCVRRGIEVTDRRSDRTAYAAFEFCAKERTS
jgi:hypothetical protein